MARPKTRSLAAFLLLVTLGSLLIASEGVQLSVSALRRLSVSAKRIATSGVGSANGPGVRNMVGAWNRFSQGQEENPPNQTRREIKMNVQWAKDKPVIGSNGGEGKILEAARKIAHQHGGLLMNPGQIRAAMLTEFMNTLNRIDLSKYENLNADQQRDYEDTQQSINAMSPEQKAALISSYQNEKKKTGLARLLFKRKKDRMEKQMMMAATHLNQDRDEKGNLNRGAVGRAIQHANTRFEAEEKREQEAQQQQAQPEQKPEPKNDTRL